MEAYLFAFLLTLGMSVFLCRQWLIAGACVGLLFLTRGEGALVLPLLIVSSLIWLRPKQFNVEDVLPALRLTLGFLVPVVVWSVYAQATFGTILPATMNAKMAQHESGLWSSFPTRLLSWIPGWEKQFTLANLPILNLWWLLIFIGLVSAITEKPKWLLFLVWVIEYIVGYTVLHVAGYWWYQLPILFVLQILAAVGLIRTSQYLVNLDKITRYAGKIAAVILVILVTAFLLKPRVNRVLNSTGDSRAASYLALCHWLQENTLPLQSVAYIEVGYLGYCTDNPIVDLAGLTTPAIIDHVAKGDFAWGFWHYQPDYFVYLPDFDWALGGIHTDARFGELYEPVTKLPGPRESDFVIYARR